ncbi:hypothetical protein C8Q74DRAFT_147131 [Fomes fomentarius]|nr:hypothetical protein C8Q74DRAFT_147131 [Fomes fomentarius]
MEDLHSLTTDRTMPRHPLRKCNQYYGLQRIPLTLRAVIPIMLKGVIPRRHRAGVESRIVGPIEEFRGPICAQNVPSLWNITTSTTHQLPDRRRRPCTVRRTCPSRNKTLRLSPSSTISTNTTMKNELPRSLMQATQFIDPILLYPCPPTDISCLCLTAARMVQANCVASGGAPALSGERGLYIS